MDTVTKFQGRAAPWNKVKLLGRKPPLKLKEIWAIRIRLQLDHRARELAPFNLAIDSKRRGCDLVGLRVHDVVQGSQIARRLARDGTSEAGAIPLSEPDVGVRSPHVSTRRHSRVVGSWVGSIGAWVSCAPRDDPDSYRRHGQPHFAPHRQVRLSRARMLGLIPRCSLAGQCMHAAVIIDAGSTNSMYRGTLCPAEATPFAEKRDALCRSFTPKRSSVRVSSSRYSPAAADERRSGRFPGVSTPWVPPCLPLSRPAQRDPHRREVLRGPRKPLR